MNDEDGIYSWFEYRIKFEFNYCELILKVKVGFLVFNQKF